MSTATVPTQEVNEKPQPIVEICEHIKDSGHRCGSPALHGRHFCFHHSRAHSPAGRLGERNYRAPLPETIESLQLQLQQITEALGSGRINDKVAGKLLYAVQLSTNLLKMKQKENLEGAPFKPSVGLSGVVPDDPTADTPSGDPRSSDPPIARSSDVVTEVPRAMYESLSPRPLTEDEQMNPNHVSEVDPDMPQTVEEARRALLSPEQWYKFNDALNRCDTLSPRYDKIVRRFEIHRRAFRILVDAGKLDADAYCDGMTAVANELERKKRKY